MRHDWIFDVLTHLRAYADENELPALAAQVAASLRVAELEIQKTGSDRACGLTAPPVEDKQKRAH